MSLRSRSRGPDRAADQHHAQRHVLVARAHDVEHGADELALVEVVLDVAQHLVARHEPARQLVAARLGLRHERDVTWPRLLRSGTQRARASCVDARSASIS